jgi:hypothetical protein
VKFFNGPFRQPSVLSTYPRVVGLLHGKGSIEKFHTSAVDLSLSNSLSLLKFIYYTSRTRVLSMKLLVVHFDFKRSRIHTRPYYFYFRHFGDTAGPSWLEYVLQDSFAASCLTDLISKICHKRELFNMRAFGVTRRLDADESVAELEFHRRGSGR